MYKLLPSIQKHEEIIANSMIAINKLQAKCPHPAEAVEFMAHESGDWYDHEYSKTFNCLRCGKRWYADSKKDPQEYRRAGKRVYQFSDDKEKLLKV